MNLLVNIIKYDSKWLKSSERKKQVLKIKKKHIYIEERDRKCAHTKKKENGVENMVLTLNQL